LTIVICRTTADRNMCDTDITNISLKKRWAVLFREAGLELIETVTGENSGSDTGMAHITARANELRERGCGKA